MKILLTGGAGFIGSNIAEALSKSHDLFIIDDFSTGSQENLRFFNKNSIVKGNICNLKDIEKCAEKSAFDAILHQAAIPSVVRSVEAPAKSTQANIMGTLNILEFARKNDIERVVLASSSAVYGDSETLPKKETMPYNPKSPYAVSKIANEMHAKNYCELYGMKTISLRYFNVYGPNQSEKSDYAAVIPKFISCMLKKQSPVIYGDGKQTRDFTFVKDVVKANVLALSAKKGFGEAFNIANGSQISLLDLFEKLKTLTGFSGNPVFQEERKGDVKHSFADISKAKSLLNYQPEYSLETGLSATLKYFKQKNK